MNEQNSANEQNSVDEKALASLRHDLRNPIGHVLGYSEMVLDELRDLSRSDLVADVEKIHAAGKRLLALVHERLNAASLGLADALLQPRQDLPQPLGQPPRLRGIGPLLKRLQHPLALGPGTLRRGDQPAVGGLQRRAALLALAACDPMELL